jgi:hypothetical protein
MADDYLATPVNKLGNAPSLQQQQGTGGSSTGGEVSYQDLLRKHQEEGERLNSNRDTSLANTQMPSPAEEMMMPRMDGYPADTTMAPPPTDPYSQYTMTPEPSDYGDVGAPIRPTMQDSPPPPPLPAQQQTQETPTKAATEPWWKTWIVRNKMGWIAAIVVFLVLTYVYPKIRSMPRFAQYQTMPHWVVAAIALASAGCMTSINLVV